MGQFLYLMMEQMLFTELLIRTLMTYKVGIVGYGVVGKRRHSAIKKIPGFKVTALSDINFGEESKFEGLKCYSDFKDLIDDKTIDVLFISLPNNFN